MNGFIKTFAILLALALCLAGPAAIAQSGGDTLAFFDGAKLRGELLSINPKSGVTWSHPEAKKPIQFNPRNIHEIRFNPLRTQTTNVEATCLARFANGDELRGDLLSLDEKTAELETWFAGRVRTDRAAVSSLSFMRAGPSTVFRGPSGAEGWNFGQGVPNQWRYEDGSFITTNVSFLGREIDLPTRLRLAFDAEWDGPLSLLVTVQSDLVTQFSYGSAGYMFSIGEGFVSVQRSGRSQVGAAITTGRAFIGQSKVPALLYAKRARLEIRTSIDGSNLYFFVNGELAAQWHDANGFLPPGRGVTFYSQRNGSRLRLGNILISEWGGELASESSTDNSNERPLVKLANKDQFTGEVHSIREGKLNVSTGKIKLNVPMDRVRQVVLEAPPLDPSGHSPDDVRVFFSDQGQMTMQLRQWTSTGVKGTHPHVGEMTLQPGWVQKLGFNLHRGQPLSDAVATMEIDPHWPAETPKPEAP